MGKLILVAVIVVLVSGSAWGSQPGQPLDCSDWIPVTPGFRCVQFAPIGALATNSPFLVKGNSSAVDNTGNLLIITGPSCWGWGELHLWQFDGVNEEDIGFFRARDIGGGRLDEVRTRSWAIDLACSNLGNETLMIGDSLTFDPVNGRVLIPLWSRCHATAGAGCPSEVDYGGGWWIAAIEGFASLYEVRQSYTPTISSLAFRVPAHPEGLRSADRGLAQIRGKKSQNEFARRAGVSGPTINRIENEAQNVSLDTLEKLCSRLKCDLGDLFPPDDGGR